MAAAFAAGYGMGAIGGLDERQVDALVHVQTRPEHPLYAANVNAADQVVISGSVTAIEAVLAAARCGGARSAHLLSVSVPSHSPLMVDITTTLERSLHPSDVHNARIPYAANVTGHVIREAARVRDDLVGNVAHPVRWLDATQALYELACARSSRCARDAS